MARRRRRRPNPPASLERAPMARPWPGNARVQGDAPNPAQPGDRAHVAGGKPEAGARNEGDGATRKPMPHGRLRAFGRRAE